MTSSDAKSLSPREKLKELFAARFPDSPGPSREGDRALVQSSAVTEPELIALYSEAYGVPVLPEDEIRQPEPFPNAPLEFFNANVCLPLEWEEDSITFLVVDPYALDQLAFLVQKTWKLKAEFRFIRRTFLERLLSKAQSMEEDDEETAVDVDDENTLRTMAGEARIVRLVNDIFTQAIELGASDIHVEPDEDHVAVRCRVDGVLTEIISCPLNQFPAIANWTCASARSRF